MPTTKGDSEAPGFGNISSSNCCNTTGGDSVAFSKWREANINDDDYNRGDTDAPAKSDGDDVDVDPAVLFRMFGEEDDEDVFEDVRYEYKTNSSSASADASSTSITTTTTATVEIRHHGAYPNSTGLAVWRGAEILARFLCDQQRSCDNDNDDRGVVAMRRKKVLEVGAGAGLPGIVAHRILGAETVLVTDGDYDALNNLKHNVSANRRQPEKGDDGSNIINNDATSSTNTISCLQLIWGRAVGAFLEAHGKQDVVLAADCVYMVPSLKPLWATIDALLEENGVFVYAQTAASAVRWKDFSEMVEFHGFETIWEVAGKDIEKYDVDNDEGGDDNDDRREDEEYEQGIYVFRRRRDDGNDVESGAKYYC